MASRTERQTGKLLLRETTPITRATIQFLDVWCPTLAWAKLIARSAELPSFETVLARVGKEWVLTAARDKLPAAVDSCKEDGEIPAALSVSLLEFAGRAEIEFRGADRAELIKAWQKVRYCFADVEFSDPVDDYFSIDEDGRLEYTVNLLSPINWVRDELSDLARQRLAGKSYLDSSHAWSKPWGKPSRSTPVVFGGGGWGATAGDHVPWERLLKSCELASREPYAVALYVLAEFHRQRELYAAYMTSVDGTGDEVAPGRWVRVSLRDLHAALSPG